MAMVPVAGPAAIGYWLGGVTLTLLVPSVRNPSFSITEWLSRGGAPPIWLA